MVALDEGNRVCLLHQYRPAAGGWVWELPGGYVDPQEDPAVTAAREVEEENSMYADDGVEGLEEGVS